MSRIIKETSFAGHLWDQKDRDGNRNLVLDDGDWQAILASAGVQAATTVAGLVAALQAAITAQKAAVGSQDT